MRPWMTRAAVLAVLHAAGAAVLAYVQAHDPGRWSTAMAAVLGVLVGAGAAWGAVDGWRRLPGRGRTWLFAAFGAGLLAGPLSLLLQSLLVDATGLESLGEAIVGGSFTALVVLGSAALGLAAALLPGVRRRAAGAAGAQPARAATASQRSARA